MPLTPAVLARRQRDEVLEPGDLARLVAVVENIGHRKAAESVGITLDSLCRALARFPISGPMRAAIHHWLAGRDRSRRTPHDPPSF